MFNAHVQNPLNRRQITCIYFNPELQLTIFGQANTANSLVGSKEIFEMTFASEITI